MILEKVKKETEIREKNKIYKKAHHSRAKYFGIGIAALIYLFFFLSNLILPQQITDKGSITKPGADNEFAENRTFSLIRAAYSEEQEMMEVLLHFTNENYDNVNDYYYTLELLGASAKGMQIEEVFNEDLFTVLRIRDLPKRFQEVRIYFAPQVVPMGEITDELTGEIILNKHNLEPMQIDTSKTRTDYLKERLDSVIAYYDGILQKQEQALKEYETRVAALKAENQEISENKSYMTEKEIQQRQETVLDNEDQIMEVREWIKGQQVKIKATKTEIKNAREKRNRLKP